MIMHGMVAEPLVAVDRVLAVDETRVETEKYISGNELIFAGHYPHAPIYPGVFLLETMLQSIGNWSAARDVELSFAGVKTLRLLSPALPGDVIRCICEVRETTDGGVVLDCVCSADGQAVAKAAVEFRYVRERVE